MGASGWDYVVDYQPNIDQAFRTLQDRVFRDGSYRHISLEVARAQGLAYPTPTSIPMLQEQTTESGTHSILDIQGLALTPREKMIAPVSTERLLELFETTTPTQEEVDQAQQESLRDGFWLFDFDEGLRDFGYYVIIYEEGNPSSVLFTGMSGD